MSREESHWGLLSGIDIGADGDPYLDRLRIVETSLFSVYLHHIHRPDKEDDPHDHPWAFWSLVLTGSYREVVWPDKARDGHRFMRLRSRWTVRRTPRRSAHMITAVQGPLWTLVLTGRDHGTWGFYRRGQYVNWRDYVGRAEAEAFDARKAAGRARGGTEL